VSSMSSILPRRHCVKLRAGDKEAARQKSPVKIYFQGHGEEDVPACSLIGRRVTKGKRKQRQR